MRQHLPSSNSRPTNSRSGLFDRWIDSVAPCPWPSHVGSHVHARQRREAGKAALYTPDERRKRDASPWTTVQAVLAPLQFLIFAVSLGLVARFLITGEGYALAVASVLAKTLVLYTIMITGSIWEKQVFDKWLFARPFFWEDVFSILVLALHTAYVLALAFAWGDPRQQMLLAIAAYATYVVNAGQFLLKLREARLEAGRSAEAALGIRRQAA